MKLNYILFALILILATACYDEKNTVAELQTATEKGFYPVSANTFVDLTNNGNISANRIYAPSANISFELQYWSLDPVKEINFYTTVGAGIKNKVFGKTYAEIAAYSTRKSADTLILAYKMPAVTAETNVRFDIEIVNENSLSLTRTVTVKAKP
jgi:hypothetical protein